MAERWHGQETVKSAVTPPLPPAPSVPPAVSPEPALDLSDPLIREMVDHNHTPEEKWSMGGRLLAVSCRQCAQPWPCSTRRALRALVASVCTCAKVDVTTPPGIGPPEWMYGRLNPDCPVHGSAP